MTEPHTASALVDQLAAIHAESTAALRAALKAYLDHGTTPDAAARVRGDWAYPELRLDFAGSDGARRPVRAFARLNRPGSYATTVTRPEMFRAYLVEQLDLLMADYDISVETGRSEIEIPYPYVLDGAADLKLDAVAASDLARWFPTTELSQIGDELADGLWDESLSDTRPLALFDGPRTDFSLARLKHYTGTAPEDFQHYILLTNYHRYVDEFVRWGARSCGGNGYERLACPGGLDIRRRRSVGGARRRRCGVAQVPDAGVAPDRTGAHGHHPGQHRRRPGQCQDDLRSPRRAAPRSLADDRPLRRAAAIAGHRRLCAGARLSAR